LSLCVGQSDVTASPGPFNRNCMTLIRVGSSDSVVEFRSLRGGPRGLCRTGPYPFGTGVRCPRPTRSRRSRRRVVGVIVRPRRCDSSAQPGENSARGGSNNRRPDDVPIHTFLSDLLARAWPETRRAASGLPLQAPRTQWTSREAMALGGNVGADPPREREESGALGWASPVGAE